AAAVQPTSAGSVRWSVSNPNRGRRAATRIASYAQIPASGTPVAATTSSTAPRGTSRSAPPSRRRAQPPNAGSGAVEYTTVGRAGTAPDANLGPGTGTASGGGNGPTPSAIRASSVSGPTSDSSARSAVMSVGSTRIRNRIRVRKSSSGTACPG